MATGEEAKRAARTAAVTTGKVLLRMKGLLGVHENEVRDVISVRNR
jgi:hypothetical protein